jgi:hypothetical protein
MVSKNTETKKTTKILSPGIEEGRNAVRQALPPNQENGFGGVNNLWEMSALPEPVSVDIAVFHHSFAPGSRRWPDAVILMSGEQAKELDDPPCDAKTRNGIPFEGFMRRVEESLAARKKSQRERGIRAGWHSGVRGAGGTATICSA